MTPRHFRSTVTDPAERGREFGGHHAALLKRGVERYSALFARAARRPYDLHQLGTQALAQIAAFAPPLHAEILGMAAGAGLDAALIGAINARTEILAYVGAQLRGECSTVVKVDAFGSAPVCVQTWDWYAEFADQWLVWEIPQADGGLTTTVTEIGIVGKAGVNRRGLGVHFNILHHAADGQTIGVPVHVLARWMLDTQDDLAQALQLLQSAAVSASTSLTVIGVVERASAAVSVELHPGGPGWVFPAADGLLVHTNHFLSSPGRDGDTEPRNYPDTLLRHDLLVRRLSQRPQLTAAQMLDALDSHLGSTGALCCHPDPHAPVTGQYATLASIVIDVAAGTLQALPGGPCEVRALLA
jgi:isopenicillin-N N-acyltransferase-like protein